MKAYNEQTFEEYYVDFDTRNVSFLKMAVLLDSAGLKNRFFFLALHDKKLKGVDPYDPDLSDEMKLRIFQECRNNRWYFYREVMRVIEPGASTEIGGGCEFKLNRGNLAYLWACSLNISCYLIMPRQTGKTWASIADCTYTHQFIRSSGILHFNKNQQDANMNLRRMQDAIRMLPMYLQHSNYDNLDPSDKRRVKNNEKSIRNAIDATIEAMASAGNEAKADAMARGKTASKLWWDELAFIFFNEALYGASIPAYEKAREIAEQNGVPYNVTITTTPGDLATPHGAFAYKMMDTAIQFREEMYDWKRKKLFDRIYNTPDKTDFLFIQFSYLQLGETEEWYLQRAKKMNNPIKARREYLLEWINSNGNSPFDPDDVELVGELASKASQHVQTLTINKYYSLNVYSEYHGRKPVIIGVDVSGGRGRDSTALVVVNPENLMPMAVFRSNMIPSNHLKKLIVTIVTKCYPYCILTVENNSIGTPLLNELKDTVIHRVLYREKKTRTVDMGVQSATRKKKISSIEYGHNTNSESRSQMMDMLEDIVHSSPAHVALPELYEEIRFLELRNGRIDHGSATHDDVTMAYLGALWIVRYGTGLKGKGIYYNIDAVEDEEDNSKVVEAMRRFTERMSTRKYESEEEKESASFVNYMRKSQPVYDSGDLAMHERASYYRTLDELEGAEDGSYEPLATALRNLPKKTEDLLLRNLNAMNGMASYDNDPFQNLLDEQGPNEMGFADSLLSYRDW